MSESVNAIEEYYRYYSELGRMFNEDGLLHVLYCFMNSYTHTFKCDCGLAQHDACFKRKYDSPTQLKKRTRSNTSVANFPVREIKFHSLKVLSPINFVTLASTKVFSKLRSLECPGVNLTNRDLKNIGRMTCLIGLDISKNNVTELNHLGAMPKLKFLDCSFNNITFGNSDYDLPFGHNLEYLKCDDTKIVDSTVLNKCTSLRTLSVHNCTLKDINFTKYMPLLINLYVSCNFISTLSPLENNANLKKFNFKNNVIDNITYLQKNTNLMLLDSSNNCLADRLDLSPFKNLVDARFSYNEITEIDGIEFPNLVLLDIRQTKIKNLNVLANSPKLSALHIDSTSISDITPICKMPINIFSCNRVPLLPAQLIQLTQLQTLSCTNSMFLSVNVISSFPRLKELYCSWQQLVHSTCVYITQHNIELFVNNRKVVIIIGS
jgi:hypothetical protein